MPRFVIGDFLRELLDKKGSFGTRADEAHIAFEDVKYLRQFIDAQLANDTPDPRSPVIVCGGPDGLSGNFCIDAHAAKFANGEGAPSCADALLQVKQRPSRIELPFVTCWGCSRWAAQGVHVQTAQTETVAQRQERLLKQWL